MYDQWREFVGLRLQVSTPSERFDGVMIGLQRLRGIGRLPVGVELPWALETSSGTVYIDPDNPAVTLFLDGRRVSPPRAKPDQRGKLDKHFLERYDAALDNAGVHSLRIGSQSSRKA